MKRSLLFLLMLFSTRAFAADPVSNGISMDGRFGTACAPSGWTHLPVCFVSIFRLLANPEQYDGKLISVTGFLVRFHGDFATYLYPSRESYEGGAASDSIALRGGGVAIPPDIASRLLQGVWVQIVGKFDAKDQGQLGAAGAIGDFLAIRRSAIAPSKHN